VETGNDNCFTYLREHQTGTYLIALNFLGESQTLAIPDQYEGMLVISTHLDRTEKISLSALTLRPNEGIIIQIDR